jgi:hypothetical protein
MKKSIFLLIMVLALSCTKSNVTEPPYAKIIFGTETIKQIGKTVGEGFAPFQNQDTINLSELNSIDVIDITVIERNVDSSYFVGTTRKPSFNFSVTTSFDKEYFISGQNCFLASYGGGGDNINKITVLQGEIQFPIKISGLPQKNNDTLEFRNDNDYLIVSYLSLYTKVFVKDSILVLKNY